MQTFPVCLFQGDPKLVSEIEKMAAKEEELQKTITSLEEENLHLKLQIEQLRLDTPRLRDRVQQLQRWNYVLAKCILELNLRIVFVIVFVPSTVGW